MRKDGKTPLYLGCPMSKLEADIMLLELKSTHGFSDKGFDDLLGVVRKLLPDPNELLGKTYLAKQMICPIGLEVKKSMHVRMIAYCTAEIKNTWMHASSLKLHGTSKGLQMRVGRLEEVP
jgi:hypothetical protein